jgi:hypothetical protein
MPEWLKVKIVDLFLNNRRGYKIKYGAREESR